MKPFDLNNDPKIKSGFKTPEGYFDDFSQNLMARINQEKLVVKQTKVISIKPKYTKLYWSVAAVFALIITGAFIYNYSIVKDNSIEFEDLENYVSYHPNITTFDLIKELNNADIKQLEENLSNNEELINNNSLETYLLNNQNIEEILID